MGEKIRERIIRTTSPDPIKPIRMYGKWHVNPEGVPEDPNTCVAEVNTGTWYNKQCSNPRKYDDYCWQHNPDKVKR